jgi:hypothetical protein
MSYTKLLDKVMNCESYVRYAVIIDNNGNKIESRQKEGTTNFLPPKEMNDSLEFALDSWKFRIKNTPFLGKNRYVIAVYDNVRRFTIPIDDEHLMLVTLDNKGGQKDMIERILSILEGDYTKPVFSGPQS